jgi:hypothetical protein
MTSAMTATIEREQRLDPATAEQFAEIGSMTY